jgi:hypothetical protein
MTKTGTYTITASGIKELAEPRSGARTKLPETLAETLLEGKPLEALTCLRSSTNYDTDAKIAAKLASWVRHGWIKKTGEVKAESRPRDIGSQVGREVGDWGEGRCLASFPAPESPRFVGGLVCCIRLFALRSL